MISEFKYILSNSKFVRLWTSQLLSQITVQMLNFLILARLFTVTGSSIATSLLWIAYALPAIFFGPIGAASVDLISRRKLLMVTNLLQALVVFGFIFTHEVSIFLLYFVVLLYSFLNQFYIPAESSSLPSLVPKNYLPQANSIFFITQQFALIAGFGLAGIIQRILGFNGSLIFCSVLLFLAFISVSFLPEMKPRTKVPESLEKLILTFFHSIYEGYEFIKSKRTLLFPLLLLLGIQTSLAIVVVNLPQIAAEILKLSISYVGLVVVVPAGVGAIIGSVIVSKFLRKGVRKKVLIKYGLLAVGISLLTAAVGTLFIQPSLRIIVTPILLIAVGIGFIAINIPTLTFLQEVTPYGIRGRVFGNLWFLITIVTIFPVLFSGFFTEFFGVRFILILIALGFLFAYYFLIKNGQKWIKNTHQ